jgi:hypothetical protein
MDSFNPATVVKLCCNSTNVFWNYMCGTEILKYSMSGRPKLEFSEWSSVMLCNFRSRIDTETDIRGFSSIRVEIVIHLPTYQSGVKTNKALIRTHILIFASNLMRTGLSIECEKSSWFRAILNIVQSCHCQILSGVEILDISDFVNWLDF